MKTIIKNCDKQALTWVDITRDGCTITGPNKVVKEFDDELNIRKRFID